MTHIVWTILISTYVLSGVVWGGFSAGCNIKNGKGLAALSFVINFAIWPVMIVALMGYIAFKIAQSSARIDKKSADAIRKCSEDVEAITEALRKRRESQQSRN